MPDPIITLTTDFGAGSPYVASMKGIILGMNPAVRLVDLTHQVPPQDLRHAAFFLATAIPCFPPGVIHLVVIDPGVGSERALLYVEVTGHRLLVPDNGCWTELSQGSDKLPVVRRLTEQSYWRQPVSATFHGRDILAPVAGHLSLGSNPEMLGPLVSSWVQLLEPAPQHGVDGWSGEVVFVDHFGNLITNIPGAAIATTAERPVKITVGEREILRQGRTYADAPLGTLLALVSSSGRLEVAANQGSAAELLGARVGTRVHVAFRKDTSPSADP